MGDMVHINSREAGGSVAASRRCKERLRVEDEANWAGAVRRTVSRVLEGVTSSEVWCYATVSR